MKKVILSLYLWCAVISGLLATEETPYYRVEKFNKVDIFSCFEVDRFPAWPKKGDDHISMTIIGLGRFDNGQKQLQVKEKNNLGGIYFASDGKTSCELYSKVTSLGKNHFQYNVTIKNVNVGKDFKPYIDLTFNDNMHGRKFELDYILNNKIFTKQIKITPKVPKENFIYDMDNLYSEIRIPMIQGLVKITNFKANIWGLKYGPAMGNLRLYLNKDDNGEYKASLDVKLIPFEVYPFNLRSFANMGFADDIAKDGKGGWTDEGGDNDFRAMKVGYQRLVNMDFDIIDPEKNNGRSCLVFANSFAPKMAEKVILNGENKKFNYLYLIHSAAWVIKDKIAGKIIVQYSDGSEKVIEVKVGKDVGNWWKPQNLINACPAFVTDNPRCSEVGVQLSRFAIDNKEIKNIILEKSPDNIQWIVLAINGVNTHDIPFSMENRSEKDWNIAVGNDYREIKLLQTPIENSMLDFSFISDAPAGKYGKVVVRNGRFEFENRPGIQARFFGANICEDAAQMLDKDLEVFIPRFKRLGFNSIRFHHHDNALAFNGKELKINAERLDDLFRTFAKFKEAGFYSTIDLFVSRKNGFNLDSTEGIKVLCMIDKETRNNLKEFTRILLTTVNPYTGMTLAEDPALLSISHINENGQFFNWEILHNAKEGSYFDQIVKRNFAEWCEKNGVKNDFKNVELLTKFITDMQNESFRDMKEFLASIGVTTPQTDMNCGDVLAQAPVRNNYDYVDIHFYLDHPTFPKGGWGLPMQFKNKSAGATFYEELLYPFASRLSGKPFMITEYKYCIPNCYRLEAGALVGALLGLHEVDGIYDFSPGMYLRSYENYLKEEAKSFAVFSCFSDPVTSLCNRLIALLYLRGDMPKAENNYYLSVPNDISLSPNAMTWRYPDRKNNKDRTPDAFNRLALVSSTAIKINAEKSEKTFLVDEVFTNNNINGLLNKIGVDPKKEIVSDNGALRVLPEKNRCIVVTPKTEAITIAEKSAKGQYLSVKENLVFSSYAASAMDEKNLAESKKILLLHITDVKHEKGNYKLYRDKLRVYSWNAENALLRKGKAKISLINYAEGEIEIYALNIVGKRLRKVPYSAANNVISFTVDNTIGEEAAMAYEIIRK